MILTQPYNAFLLSTSRWVVDYFNRRIGYLKPFIPFVLLIGILYCNEVIPRVPYIEEYATHLLNETSLTNLPFPQNDGTLGTYFEDVGTEDKFPNKSWYFVFNSTVEGM